MTYKLVLYRILVNGSIFFIELHFRFLQSDDKSLRVWKTLDWTQETCVTEPFQEVRSIYNIHLLVLMLLMT